MNLEQEGVHIHAGLRRGIVHIHALASGTERSRTVLVAGLGMTDVADRTADELLASKSRNHRKWSVWCYLTSTSSTTEIESEWSCA
jgi:hypothetical protein